MGQRKISTFIELFQESKYRDLLVRIYYGGITCLKLVMY